MHQDLHDGGGEDAEQCGLSRRSPVYDQRERYGRQDSGQYETDAVPEQAALVLACDRVVCLCHYITPNR